MEDSAAPTAPPGHPRPRAKHAPAHQVGTVHRRAALREPRHRRASSRPRQPHHAITEPGRPAPPDLIKPTVTPSERPTAVAGRLTYPDLVAWVYVAFLRQHEAGVPDADDMVHYG
ncbi:hypothetical protein GCM10018966_026210 [Streptomyces yanii]